MAIYQPDLLLSQDDRETLLLLGHLALASEDDASANLPTGAVPLAAGEAARLLTLLEQFASSKLFIEGSYFAEGISRGEADNDDRLRAIYFAWRGRRGFTNVMANQRWREFVLRAGFNSSQNAWMWPHDLQRSPLRPMTLEHFLRMEAKLATAASLHPRVQRLLLTFIEEMLPALDNLRERRTQIAHGTLTGTVRTFIGDLEDHVQSRERAPMTRRRVVALATIVMDTATLFASRDWTAAGILSTMAAVVPDAVGYGQHETND